MTNEQINMIKTAAKDCGCRCDENILLSGFTTFGIGGKCPLMIEVNGEESLKALLPMMNDIPFYVIGKGSNLLISDRDIDMIFLHMGRDISSISLNGDHLTCGAGASLSLAGTFAKNNSLTGLEFAYGIPGNIGGAVYMNAGAYGGEMKDIVQSVRAVDYSGNAHEFSAEELDFGYRHSKFCGGGYIITEATLKLAHGDMDEISAKMAELTAKRKEKQPLEYRSAGSTFKRPQGTFAALLIEQCGLKGYSCGAAQVSEKHSGFVINKGGASFDDVMSVISHVKETVYAKTGIMLECEPKIIE